MPQQRTRGFSLLELMVVVAIIGIVASVAAPNMSSMVRHYRALEGSRIVVSAINDARALAQRNNTPVELALFSDRAELRLAVVTGTPEQVRREVTGYTATRTISLVGARVTALQVLNGETVTTTTTPTTTTPATLRFCASSDNYLRDASAQPICGIGNLASANARVVFQVLDDTFNIRIRAAMATVNVRSGAT